MKRILERNKEDWMIKYATEDITIGLKEKNGEITDELCFKFWVTTKASKLLMWLIARSEIIPKELVFVTTDVKEEEEYTAYVDGTERLRPILMGCSGGNLKGGTGTPGFLYKKDGKFYLLSNGHVWAEDPFKYISDQETKVVQPGPYHGGKYPDDYVGDMRYMILLNEYGSGVEVIAPGICDDGTFTQAGYNTADAALSNLKEGVEAKPDIIGIANAPRVKECIFQPGDEIISSSWVMGGVTEAIVTDIGKSSIVQHSNGKKCRLVDQVVTTKFGDPGSSGMGVMRKRDMAAGGLNHAGSQSLNLVCAIQHINTAFGGEVVVLEGPEKPNKPYELTVYLKLKPNGEGGLSGNYELHGICKNNESKLPIQGVEVKIKEHDLETDPGGNFWIYEISPGEYDLEFSHPEFNEHVERLVLKPYL